MKNIEKLDRQSLLLIAVEMDTPSLLNLCKSSKRINEMICQKPQIWIDKLKRDFDFTFFGTPIKERDPRKYYQILYDPPKREEFKLGEDYSYIFDNDRKIKNLYYNSIFEAIRHGYLDLVTFLCENFLQFFQKSKYENEICFMLYLAIENKHKDIFFATKEVSY